MQTRHPSQLPAPDSTVGHAFGSTPDGTIFPSGVARSLPGVWKADGSMVVPEVSPGGTDPNWTYEAGTITPAEIPDGAPRTETPSGTVNGTNRIFTLTATPTGLVVTINGAVTTAWTVSGTTLTFNSAPASGSIIEATFWA
jgi:hypothetical protein